MSSSSQTDPKVESTEPAPAAAAAAAQSTESEVRSTRKRNGPQTAEDELESLKESLKILQKQLEDVQNSNIELMTWKANKEK